VVERGFLARHDVTGWSGSLTILSIRFWHILSMIA